MLNENKDRTEKHSSSDFFQGTGKPHDEKKKRRRLTNDQKLARRRVSTPNSVIYNILMAIAGIMNSKIHTEFIYNAKPGENDGPFILISNHASRNDYLFTAPPCLPKKLNYVVGYNEFYRFPINIVLKIMNVIPKKNFTPDISCIKNIYRVIEQGGNICFMPEGMSSITGMCQPVIPGGASLLKKLAVPVYYTKISGGYLTYTKHCLDERPGKVEVTVDQMFSSDQLKKMSEEEIEDTMNRLLAHDDYIWNKTKQIKFKSKGTPAKQLDTLLYLCPKCGKLYTMKSSKNLLTCSECGNTVKIDDCYNISPVGEGSVCPELISDWTIMERERAAADVKKENFSYSMKVKIGFLPDRGSLHGGKTSIISGSGILTINRDGLQFSGENRSEEFQFRIPSASIPTFGMCTDISRLYTFVNGKFIEFYPENQEVLRFDHLTEEMHRANGGKWQNTKYRHLD